MFKGEKVRPAASSMLNQISMFVGLPQVFQDTEAQAGAARCQEAAGDGIRGVQGIGINKQQTGCGHGGVQGFPAPAVEADDPGLVPAHLEAGRGGLDRGEIGVQHDVFRPQEPHRQGTDAVKIGVPRGQDDHAPVYGQGRQLPESAGRVLPQDDPWGGVVREIVEEAPAPRQHLGFADDAQGPGGEVLRRHAQSHHLNGNHTAAPDGSQ